MNNQFRVDGQVALVTGATGGLGGAMCRAFAAAGANVALAEHPSRVDDAHRLARELSQLGVSTTAVAMDVTDLASIEAGVAADAGHALPTGDPRRYPAPHSAGPPGYA